MNPLVILAAGAAGYLLWKMLNPVKAGTTDTPANTPPAAIPPEGGNRVVYPTQHPDLEHVGGGVPGTNTAGPGVPGPHANEFDGVSVNPPTDVVLPVDHPDQR